MGLIADCRGRNWLGGCAGDRSNAMLAAVSFSLRQLLRFLKGTGLFLCPFLRALLAALLPQEAAQPLLNPLDHSAVHA